MPYCAAGFRALCAPKRAVPRPARTAKRPASDIPRKDSRRKPFDAALPHLRVGLRAAALCLSGALALSACGDTQFQRRPTRRSPCRVAGRSGFGHDFGHLRGRLHGGAVPRRAFVAGERRGRRGRRPVLLCGEFAAPCARPLHEGRRTDRRRRTGRNHERTRPGRPHRPDREPGQRSRVDLPRRGRPSRGQAGRRCIAGVLRTARGPARRAAHGTCGRRPHVSAAATGICRTAARPKRRSSAAAASTARGSCSSTCMARSARRTQASNRATLVHFSQSSYARRPTPPGCAARGWLYVPAACSGDGAAGRCRLHVAFHGCKQGASFVKDAFVQQSGYLAAADAGRIVVLFPQVEPSFQPLNPNGCWDWWGYGGDGVRNPGRAADRGCEGDGRRLDGCGRPGARRAVAIQSDAARNRCPP